jgi:hypothetical protein
MQVAEIAVRFGDSPLAMTRLAAGTYRIGTAPDVDFAVEIAGLTTFPLVEHTSAGVAVRIPVGIAARRSDGSVAEGRITLVRSERVSVELGRVAIEIASVDHAPRVPRPMPQPQFASWIALALIAHVAFLGLADMLADPEPTGVQVSIYARVIAALPEPPLPETVPSNKKPARAKPAAATVVAQLDVPQSGAETERALPEPVRRARAIERSRGAGILGSSRLDFSGIVGTKDLEKELSDVGPVYRDYEAEAQGFGGGRRFDPTKDPRFNSVASGRYATVSGGRAVGDQYALPGEVGRKEPPRVALCTAGCTATADARRALAGYTQAVLGCYERNGGGKRGDVVVEFEVGADGKVIHAEGEGLGETGACVAGVVRRVAFPKSAATVRFPLTFEP